MKVSQGIHCWQEYRKLHSKKNTLRTYQSILSKFSMQFGERDINSITPDEILSFLTQINEGTKKLTKRTRYSQLTSFFNFITQNLDPNFRSPSDTPVLKKFYRSPLPHRRQMFGYSGVVCNR
jgi:site-specific recombinase XerD